MASYKMTQLEIISPRLKTALAYAAQGIPVFPCIRGGKEPARGQSYLTATTDPETIRHIWAEDDYNLGVCPETAGWGVVDLDGAEGMAWEGLRQTPPTRTVATPSGGLHLYFEGSLPCSVRKLGPGIDTRGRGSYVLVPPSVVDGKPYTLVDDAPIAPLPAWISDQLQARDLPRLTAPEDIELDRPWNIDKARAILRDAVRRGDVAVEGQGGDDRTYRLAAQIIEIGLSEETAAELLAEEWNPHCEPPWSDDALTEIVFHAWKYRQNEPGSRGDPDPAIWTEYVAAAAPPPAEPEPPVFPGFEAADAIAARPEEETRWLWEERMLERQPVYVTGRDGSGKTTFAENLAVAVAAGVPLWGKATMQMPVFLLVGEDSADYVARNLVKIAASLQAPAECLSQIRVLSTLDAEIMPTLAVIDDDGTVKTTAFMQHVVGLLRPPCLFIVDPLETFVRFDRYKDAPARALCDGLLRPLCRAGVTPIVNDHPSKASQASGDHYAGSVQVRAPFPVHATLIAGEWSGVATPQKDITLSFRKIRRAREHDVKLIRRGNHPAFVLQGGPNHTPDDHQVAVYRHVYERIAAELPVNLTDHGYGPSEIGWALSMDKSAVKVALSALVVRQWLDRPRGAGGYVIGPKGPSAGELDGF